MNKWNLKSVVLMFAKHFLEWAHFGSDLCIHFFVHIGPSITWVMVLVVLFTIVVTIVVLVVVVNVGVQLCSMT